MAVMKFSFVESFGAESESAATVNESAAFASESAECESVRLPVCYDLSCNDER